MAIAFDAATGQGFTSGSSFTKAHTCTGTDRGLLVMFRNNENSDLVTGVTYAGTAMTQAIKYHETGGNSAYVYGYYLANPASGSNNVVISASGTILVAMFIHSYTGVHQTSMLDAAASFANTGTASVTTSADNCWYAGIFRSYTGGESATSGNGRLSLGSGNGAVSSDNGPKTPAGTATLSYGGGGNWYGGIIISIAPAASGETPVFIPKINIF